MEKLQLDLSRIPIWVHLFNVPLELFNCEGLSYIASAIGYPISMDSITASKSRLEFAKICVEVGPSEAIPKFVDVVLNNGKTVSIVVEVPWMPPCCKYCNVFGHSVKGCKQNPIPQTSTMVWRKKKFATSTPLDSEIVCTEHKQNATSVDPKPSLNISSKDFEGSNHSSLESNHSVNDSDASPEPIQQVSTMVNDQETSTDLNEEENSIIPYQLGNFADTISAPTLLNKRNRGRHAKAHDALTGSSNRFELLNTINETLPTSENQGKKVRAAASGVAVLIKELKIKKKSHLDKSKGSSVGSQGGEPSSSSQGK
ncbi:uncharacterized protein LOC120128424 [Hibiscus syriacus]|uniref:uncharacterized protein LOC120128424 n=1 Tax=Hibiscus syriacus TaxID=106335 RepID=UPI00192246C9|nr:uncharacterized protein LOC120128424 [Hibiscus syriacus]